MKQWPVLGPTTLGQSAGLFLKEFNGAEDVSSALSPPTISKKKNDTSPASTQNPATVMAKKTWFFVFYPKILFQPIFDQKYLENILETLLNQSMTTKKPKTAKKPEIYQEQKPLKNLKTHPRILNDHNTK
jgi:hypothetical protein